MHPLLEEFMEKWVWPVAPGSPGAEFRLRLTEEKCIKGWDFALRASLGRIERELDSGNEEWKVQRAMGGYAGEGIHMSIKHMSALLLTVDIGEQEKYIDLLRVRTRQLWDECKHSKLHVDVLMGKGAIKNERELMEIPAANTNGLPEMFGQIMMLPVIHPLARAGIQYFQETNACLDIVAHLSLVDDPLVRHEHLSQRAEELMHFMQGKYTIDTYCGTPETQKPVEETVDWLLHQMWRIQ